MSAAERPPVNRSADAARAWRGAAVLSRGFRPFFLGAGVWAAVGMTLWRRSSLDRSRSRPRSRRSTGTRTR